MNQLPSFGSVHILSQLIMLSTTLYNYVLSMLSHLAMVHALKNLQLYKK